MWKIKQLLISLLAVLINTTVIAQDLPKPKLLDNSKQLIVVTTDSWDASTGRLQQFIRKNVNAPWHAVALPWDVVVGKKGLGWAANLQHYQQIGPIKKEGDGKAPAGVFSLYSSFGFAQVADKGVTLPYKPITNSTVCVDDSNSIYYGRIIDSKKVSKIDWSSGEEMSHYPEQYQRGIVVNYNTDGKIKQGGSCIFLHVRAASDTQGTAGCTAMAPNKVTELMTWLKPASMPTLIQLPAEQYQQLQKSWGLPSLS